MLLPRKLEDTGRMTVSDVSEDQSWPKAAFTAQELYIVRCESVAFCCLTIAACLVYFYWFIRSEKKRFRNMLIFALVASDFSRTVFTLAYPLVVFTQGESSESTAACTASGFFTNFFFSQSDYIIMIIAIHTALSVYRPVVSTYGKYKEGGLWVYRYWVFAGYVLEPTLLSSLAFLNPNGAYVPLSIWCWLPAAPIYWRMFLAWTPRYITFIIVIITYVVLMIYVHRVYKLLDKGLLSSQDASDTDCVEDSGDTEQVQERNRQGSTQDPESIPPESLHFAGTSTPSTPIKPEIPIGLEQSRLMFEKRRAKVLKQMRLLFIFPIIYILGWQIPFAQHIMTLVSKDVTYALWILYNMSAILIASQGFINVMIFAIEDKPWRNSDKVHFFCLRTIIKKTLGARRKKPSTSANTDDERKELQQKKATDRSWFDAAALWRTKSGASTTDGGADATVER